MPRTVYWPRVRLLTMQLGRHVRRKRDAKCVAWMIDDGNASHYHMVKNLWQSKLKLAHPGKILREEVMEPVGLSAYSLAKSLDVPRPRVNDIVREKRAVSPEMAVLLSAYFGTTDSYWINLQAHYDLELAKDRVGKQAARIAPHPHDKNGALQPV